MAEVQPLRALHYDLGRPARSTTSLAPPYDVIDAGERSALVAPLAPTTPSSSTCPRTPAAATATQHAARTLNAWRDEGILAPTASRRSGRSSRPTRGPDGSDYTRRGFLARVRVSEYGPGLVRPHERTQPGPKRGPPRADPRHASTTSPPSSASTPATPGRLLEPRAGRALGRGDRRRRHRQPRLAGGRPRGDRGRDRQRSRTPSC